MSDARPAGLPGTERVVVLTRQGCHLCAEAIGIVDGVCADLGVRWRSVDVDAEPALRGPWSDHVPVTFIDGVLFSRWFVDAENLRDQLTGTGRSGTA